MYRCIGVDGSVLLRKIAESRTDQKDGSNIEPRCNDIFTVRGCGQCNISTQSMVYADNSW